MFYASTKSGIQAAVLAAAMLLSAPAFAHDGHSLATGLVSGFLHPLQGADHLLAMLAIGISAAQYKGTMRWLMLLSFPALMLMGAIVAIMAIRLPGIEPGIAGTVAIMGLLIAFAVRMPAWAIATTITLFALLHGYAHGVESPQGSSSAVYGAGFVVATLTLHMIGLAIGTAATGKTAHKAVRMLGAAIAAAGTYLLVAVG